ncbi:MAG: hypothetical protein ACR2GU_01200 [Rubrobacteraceae bacterium]
MASDLYGRRVLLRNCGRFLNVAGDFGSNYSTHPYLSSEMLYAGLTRELSRRPRTFSEKMSGYDFFGDFDVASLPVWFTPGILIDGEDRQAAGRAPNLLDTHLFNSTLEERPGIQDNKRLPKYGSMETVLPGNLFSTLAISSGADSLNTYSKGQVFWMGKKRTMFQIEELGEMAEAELMDGQCATEYVQVSSQDMGTFEAYSVLGASQRYLVASGEGSFEHLSFSSTNLRCVPKFAIQDFLDAL